MDNLDIYKTLVKNIKGVERTFGEYLFTTYIIPKLELDNLSKIKKEEKIKLERDKFKNEFFINKPQIINQEQQIRIDIDDIKKANDIYEKYPDYEKKVTKTVYGYPDRYRCNYIILNKHKYYRCKAKVLIDKDTKEQINNNLPIEEYNDLIYEEYCSHHINNENTNLDTYIKLINKYIT